MGKKQSKPRPDEMQQEQIDAKLLPSNRLTACSLSLNDELLLEIIDIEHGLLRDLRSSHVLDTEQVELVENEGRTLTARIGQLIDQISNLNDMQQLTFLSVLEKNDQSHVANYIRNKGQRQTIDDKNWPIEGDSLWEAVGNNWHELIDIFDSRDHFLDELLSVNCISTR